MINGFDFLSLFSSILIQAQVMLKLSTFNNTWLIGLVFFSIHLYFLGYLVFKSEYIPRILGVLLIVASLGYMIDCLANLLISNYADYAEIFSLIVIIPGVIGELSFTFWLLIRANKIPEIESLNNNK